MKDYYEMMNNIMQEEITVNSLEELKELINSIEEEDDVMVKVTIISFEDGGNGNEKLRN